MMLKRCFLIILILLTVISSLVGPAVYAADPETLPEDPATAQEIFSSIALLRYCSSSLDYVIQLDQAGSDNNLLHMPFANVPQILEEPTGNFANYGTQFTGSLVKLFDLWQLQNEYISQYRLQDAANLYRQITLAFPEAQMELSQMLNSVYLIGIYLRIDSLPSKNTNKIAYNEVINKIQQLQSMLDLIYTPELSEIQDLQSSQLTLVVDPLTAFVGDTISFTGVLSSANGPMAGREITLLFANTKLLTIKTDIMGRYQGKFQLPYRYVPEADVQAIYYPQGDDAGVYLAATSPVVQIAVLYYQAKLTLVADNPAYPGRMAILHGNLDYGSAPVPAPTEAEIYLDDTLVNMFEPGSVFMQEFQLDPQIVTGKHIINVSLSAHEQYAPVYGTCILQVSLLTVVLELNAPHIAIIPGNIGISGKLYSEIGPLNDATVKLRIGNTQTQVTTSSDGSFSTKQKMGMGLTLIGNESVSIQVQPQEPWNKPLSTSRNIFLINIMNTSILVVLVLVLSVYLPRRFRKWFGAYVGKRTALPQVVPSEPMLVYTESNKLHNTQEEETEGDEEKTNPLLYWYRAALQLVQKLTRTFLKPQQTLREYGSEVSRKLGPVGKYFIELTYLIEKRLYSHSQLGEEDVAKGKELAQNLQNANPDTPESK